MAGFRRTPTGQPFAPQHVSGFRDEVRTTEQITSVTFNDSRSFVVVVLICHAERISPIIGKDCKACDRDSTGSADVNNVIAVVRQILAGKDKLGHPKNLCGDDWTAYNLNTHDLKI